jgi:hypothetical protein
MTSTERRKNARPENCRACGVFCEAGQGNLYRDTTSRTVNRLGKFGWFVKCNSCNDGGKTRLTVTMEKQAAARSGEVAVRPWSVSQVKKWIVSRMTHEGEVAIQIDAGSFVEVVSYRDRINSRFTAPTGYSLEQIEFAGKPLSEKASRLLSEQILPIVVAVQSEEKTSGEIALEKMIAAGATAKPCPSGHGWRVEFQGGRYTLWGCVDGKNQVSGLDPTNKWIETTAESLLAAEE